MQQYSSVKLGWIDCSFSLNPNRIGAKRFPHAEALSQPHFWQFPPRADFAPLEKDSLLDGVTQPGW